MKMTKTERNLTYRMAVPILEPSDTPKWYQFIYRHRVNKWRKKNLHRAMYALMRIGSGEEFYIKPYPDRGEGRLLVVWMDAEDISDNN